MLPAPVSPVIGKLIEDHQLVAAILRQVRELLGPDRPPSPPAALLRELDGLTAILESHFSFEERRVAQALNTLDPGSVDLRLPPLLQKRMIGIYVAPAWLRRAR